MCVGGGGGGDSDSDRNIGGPACVLNIRSIMAEDKTMFVQRKDLVGVFLDQGDM